MPDVDRIVQVAAVENQRLLEQPLHPIEVRLAELIPFRQDHDAIGVVQGVISIFPKIQFQMLGGFLVPFRIKV